LEECEQLAEALGRSVLVDRAKQLVERSNKVFFAKGTLERFARHFVHRFRSLDARERPAKVGMWCASSKISINQNP
jgi:hypothetical protein